MTIEDLVKSQLDQIDFSDLIREEFKEMFRSKINSEFSSITKEEIQSIIKSEVSEIMANPITIQDGWSKTDQYNSFEEFFKKEFKKALNDRYQIQNFISDHIKNETKKLVEAKTKEIVDALKAELTK